MGCADSSTMLPVFRYARQRDARCCAIGIPSLSRSLSLSPSHAHPYRDHRRDTGIQVVATAHLYVRHRAAQVWLQHDGRDRSRGLCVFASLSFAVLACFCCALQTRFHVARDVDARMESMGAGGDEREETTTMSARREKRRKSRHGAPRGFRERERARDREGESTQPYPHSRCVDAVVDAVRPHHKGKQTSATGKQPNTQTPSHTLARVGTSASTSGRCALSARQRSVSCGSSSPIRCPLRRLTSTCTSFIS